MTLQLRRTTSADNNFKTLVSELDQDLALRDGDDHAFYHQFNGIDQLNHCVVGYWEETPIACGAMKPLEPGSVEVKRMYVSPDFRGKGIATELLSELELWAEELGFENCVLETGKRQPEAIALYKKNGYQVTENYGPYIGVENSVCFRKTLVDST